jgi:ATP/maltotriose-dependent transcriptional regulator MalT
VTHPLMATKLYVPKLRRGLVARPRLLERMGHGAEARLTLVRPGRVRQDDGPGGVAVRGVR